MDVPNDVVGRLIATIQQQAVANARLQRKLGKARFHLNRQKKNRLRGLEMGQALKEAWTRTAEEQKPVPGRGYEPFKITAGAAPKPGDVIQCPEGKPVETAEEMREWREWREAAGCREGQTLLERIKVLAANAANWEAEALERAQNQTDLEDRMDEARNYLERSPRNASDIYAAIELLNRGEGAEITQAQAWENTARALDKRIDAAVEALERGGGTTAGCAEALSILTTDEAGDDPNIVDGGGE